MENDDLNFRMGNQEQQLAKLEKTIAFLLEGQAFLSLALVRVTEMIEAMKEEKHGRSEV